MSFALFNILVLFSRTSNSFLGPFLAKRIETRIHDGNGASLFIDMQFVLAAASVATLIGILLVPTGQRMFAAAIGWYQTNRSTTRSEEHTSELQSLMRTSYADSRLKKQNI